MNLRNKLLALSLLTLLLPWSGWMLLQELERYLREAQEFNLLASTRMAAATIPLSYQTRLLYAPDHRLRLIEMSERPQLDGAAGEWPELSQALVFSSSDEQLRVSVQAARHAGRLYLMFEVHDATADHSWPGPADSIELMIRNPRGLFHFHIKPGAPGPLSLRSEGDAAGQLRGFWMDRENGYRAELSIPGDADDSSISFLVRDAGNLGGKIADRFTGTLSGPDEVQWIVLSREWPELSQHFAAVATPASRMWLVDRRAWVLADSGSTAPVSAAPQSTTWLQRFLYRLVTGSPPEIHPEWPQQPLRLDDAGVKQALAGEHSIEWTQTLDTAEVRNTLAVPVRLENRPDGEIIGALVVQSRSEGLLLITNRALGRLLLTTLGLALGLALGMWWFAIRLSRRVRRLSGAVSVAMEQQTEPAKLPLTSDHDELGELARNNDRLLQAVADFSHYLQSLAGKLSHELKTPLAITRSSLENLASQLPFSQSPEAQRYLDRAREGVDRQGAIVRAMSEANRLESAIEAAEWETIDLVALLESCAGGYRTAYPGRRIATRLMAGPLPVQCAPDLLAQALDKLVDNALSLSGAEDTVTLRLRKDGNQAWLAVENTGSRLPDEFQDRLFDSLVSVRQKPGTGPHLGLGLYIVKLVVMAHSGEVIARNLPRDSGVQFRLRIPLSQAGR